ncbi:hypothetical protein [Pseudomonas sp. BYT-5]|nr:hypothetical protein [Pseudomonas sp. BYT-5]
MAGSVVGAALAEGVANARVNGRTAWTPMLSQAIQRMPKEVPE